MDTQKAVTLIEKSQHVLLLLPSELDLDAICTAEVLTRKLDHMGKRVGFLTPPLASHGGYSIDTDIFHALAVAPPMLKEFIISVNTTSAPIDELRYEKQEDHVDIILSPQSSAVQKHAVTFQDGNTQCDVTITIGVPDIDQVTNIMPEPDFFTERPIINIDHTSNNKVFGEANIIDSKKASLSEVLYVLLQKLDQRPLDSESATLLLAGVLSKTGKLHAPTTDADTLQIASEFVRLGADYARALTLTNTATPIDLFQLFGRATVRSKVDSNKNIFWSFLTKEDFEKTGRSEEDIPLVIAHFKQVLPSPRYAALLWQLPANGKIRAALFGGPNSLDALRTQHHIDATIENGHLLLPTTYANFQDAETSVETLLDATL